jgi:hypothetical protein
VNFTNILKKLSDKKTSSQGKTKVEDLFAVSGSISNSLGSKNPISSDLDIISYGDKKEDSGTIALINDMFLHALK